MKYLFYVKEYSQEEFNTIGVLDSRYTAMLWRPKLMQFTPPGISKKPFIVWWIFHYLKIFVNQEYSLFLVYMENQLVHRSLISPKYFKFPFMLADDLQIGDVWTEPKSRNQGLAKFAITEILKMKFKHKRKFWYIVENGNIASINLVESLGFNRVGEGDRRLRFGNHFLGYYSLNNNVDEQHV